MKTRILSQRVFLVWATTILFVASLSHEASACTACMGASTGPIGEAANGAIFVMLGVLAVVLGLISLVGYSLVKRANLPMPPHVELVRSIAGSNLS
jgi:hypothetical protein